jgi:hypothetical protein
VEREGVEAGEREGFGKVIADFDLTNPLCRVKVDCNHGYYTLCDARH